MIAATHQGQPNDALAIDAEVIIVGAGFGGLGMAIELKKAGRHSFIVLERAPRLGGAWRDNIYPGCACDIPAMLYSFSFSRHTSWSRIYPRQAEILTYLELVAKRHRLLGNIRFNSDLSEARFEEPTGTWAVTLTDGTILRSHIVISSMGPLNRPKFPQIDGRDTFAGASFHSSEWDYGVDLETKQVAVIGTGASAIQFVPHIAPRAGVLTVFQRTAPWIIPRDDKPVGRVRALARKLVPMYAWLVRKAIYWTLEIRALGFVVNPKLLAGSERDMLRFIARSVPDPALRAKITPSYRAGCKRILLSDDYYPAIAQPNVEVVTQPIVEIRSHSIVTQDGREIPADVIIYATGFAATEGIAPVRVYGLAGVELADAWSTRIQAYLGTCVAGYPNLFIVIGPNTGLGHNSMVLMMEAQYRYIVGAVKHLARTKKRYIDVKADVMRSFNDEVQRRLKRTVWETGCSSWYQDARGNNVSLWPGFTFAFRKRTSRFDPSRYRAID